MACHPQLWNPCPQHICECSVDCDSPPPQVESKVFPLPLTALCLVRGPGPQPLGSWLCLPYRGWFPSPTVLRQEPGAPCCKTSSTPCHFRPLPEKGAMREGDTQILAGQLAGRQSAGKLQHTGLALEEWAYQVRGPGKSICPPRPVLGKVVARISVGSSRG